MADAGRFKLDILCPSCGATGEAQGFADIPRLFHVDTYPEGFSEVRSSGLLQETIVRCDCGQEFYLL